MSRCEECGWSGANCDCANQRARMALQGYVRLAELVGAQEASGILHLTQARMGQLRKSDPAFPKPVHAVAATPLWLITDLIKYNRERVIGRPGRPKKDSDA